MLASSIPTKFPIPFANNAGSGFTRAIPTDPPAQLGAASLQSGFPSACFNPPGAGGTWPFGQDFNGILNQISAWAQWFSAGGPIVYDSGFQTAVGGYPSGAVVQSATTAGLYWLSTADNNTSNPDTGGSNWRSLGGTGVTRSLTASGSFTFNANDIAVGLNRTVSPGVSSATLLSTWPNGWEIEVGDLAGNFNAYPVTISAPGGYTIGGKTSVTLNVNAQTAIFRFYKDQSSFSVKL